MVGILMMQSMAIHPGDRIYIDPKDIIHDGDGFYEPFLIVESAMRDSHDGEHRPNTTRQETNKRQNKLRPINNPVHGPK